MKTIIFSCLAFFSFSVINAQAFQQQTTTTVTTTSYPINPFVQPIQTQIWGTVGQQNPLFFPIDPLFVDPFVGQNCHDPHSFNDPFWGHDNWDAWGTVDPFGTNQQFFPQQMTTQFISPPIHNFVNPIHTVYPMNQQMFGQALMQMQSQGFDSNRLMIAMQILSVNMVTSNQVAQLMNMLSFENSRLELAKFAFRRVIDPQNFFIVNNAFSFGSSATELSRFLYGF